MHGRRIRSRAVLQWSGSTTAVVWAEAQQASLIHALSFTMLTIKSCGHSFLNTYICWSLFNGSKGLMTGWIALIGWRGITAGSEQKIQSYRFPHWNRITLFQERTVFSLTWHFNSLFLSGQKTHLLLMVGKVCWRNFKGNLETPTSLC